MKKCFRKPKGHALGKVDEVPGFSNFPALEPEPGRRVGAPLRYYIKNPMATDNMGAMALRTVLRECLYRIRILENALDSHDNS